MIGIEKYGNTLRCAAFDAVEPAWFIFYLTLLSCLQGGESLLLRAVYSSDLLLHEKIRRSHDSLLIRNALLVFL